MAYLPSQVCCQDTNARFQDDQLELVGVLTVLYEQLTTITVGFTTAE